MIKIHYSLFLSFLLILNFSCNSVQSRKTVVSIASNQFLINGKPTYSDRYWNNYKIEGLLFNSRMVQGIFDDYNPQTCERFKYPDTKQWDAERNTTEFIAAMPDWLAHGMLAFTLNLQGGSPMGYGNEGWINSTFDSLGNLQTDYINRLERILDKADELGMVVILGYFYFGQDEQLKDEQAVINGVDNITKWILEKGYKNILIEIDNECNVKRYDHEILRAERVHELIGRVKDLSHRKLLVSASFGGNKIPTSNVVEASDFILLHGNNVKEPKRISEMVTLTKEVSGYKSQPIIFNEDDHFDFDKEDNHLLQAVKSYASWGYFDFRMEGENFSNGFQSVPVDWKISSERKKQFFNKIKEISGY